MSNSNITLQNVLDDANSLGDVAPALATGGFSDAPALSIANDVMQAMINGGPDSQPYPWKWNRINVAPFSTISYQSDYFVPGLINFGWIENAWAVNINQTSVPKQKLYLDARKDIQVTYDQTGYPGKIAWMQNSNILTGVWGQTPLGPTASSPLGNVGGLGPGITGNQNPGPNVIYTNPVGVLNQPANATTCITDPNGNLWALTTFGTCGATQPTWPTTPVFPTVVDPTVVATTVTDGSVVWTAINPAGQGFRLNPIPAQTGTVWVVNVVGQMKANRFKNVAQTLEPIPDDYEWAFKQGFFAQCYRRNPDPKIRAKFTMENQLWLQALDKAVRQSDREEDDFGFYPGSAGVMDTNWGGNPITPAYPFNGMGGY